MRYVLFLADETSLPDPRIDVARAGNESFHPPLYYAALAAVLRTSGIDHRPVYPQRVPGWTWDTVPRNYFQPTSAPAGYLHLLREASLLFGVVTLVCTYLAATLLGMAGLPRASATAATATLPQFTYISAAVNPDSLAAALAAVGLVLLLKLLVGTDRPRITAPAFGAVTGLAVLAEYHTVYLLALAALAYLFVSERGMQRLARDGAIASLAFVAVAGWWFVLNLTRYGDVSGMSLLFTVAPELVTRRSLLDPYFVFFFPALTYESFLGVFGWLNAYLPAPFYLAYGLLWLAALSGISRAVTRRWSSAMKTLVLAPLIILVLVVYQNLSFNAPQGRYFFAALVALSVLFAAGLAELPYGIGRWAVTTAPIFLFAANLYSLAFVAISFARG